MAILLDASAILAAADTADLNHAAARAWFAAVDEPLLVGALTLAEADHVLQRELGPAASLALVAACTSGAVRVVAPTDGDLERAAALLRVAARASAAALGRPARRGRRAARRPPGRDLRPPAARGARAARSARRAPPRLRAVADGRDAARRAARTIAGCPRDARPAGPPIRSSRPRPS